jgi:hypothetical protein
LVDEEDEEVEENTKEVEVEMEAEAEEVVKVKPEEQDEEVWITGNKNSVVGMPNELSDAGPRSASPQTPPTTMQPNGSSSGLAIDVDADDDMGMDLPSSKDAIVVDLDHWTSAPSDSSRFEPELKVDRHAHGPIAEQTKNDQQAVSGRRRRHPIRHHMVRYQRTPGPPIPVTKEYVRALRDIFIPPRPPPVDNEVEPEKSGFSNMRNQQELICPNGLCRQYGCSLHGESLGRVVVRERKDFDPDIVVSAVDDAVRDVIPFWPIPGVPATAHRLIDMTALEDMDFEPCSMTDCWFTASDNERTAVEGLDMRELDLSHLKTFMNGMSEVEDDWKVCELVDMFDESAEGPVGRGWSCVQVSKPRRSKG